jgi:hypothetical protein
MVEVALLAGEELAGQGDLLLPGKARHDAVVVGEVVHHATR